MEYLENHRPIASAHYVGDYQRAWLGLAAGRVAIDTTLSHEAPYPASVQDVNYGVRWLKAKAREWNGDASHIGILGSSSGGHVAELVAMRPRDPRYNAIPLPEAPNLDATVAYVATRSPISDCHARYEHMVKTNRPEMIKKTKLFFDPWDSIFEANPMLMLERGEPTRLAVRSKPEPGAEEVQDGAGLRAHQLAGTQERRGKRARRTALRQES